MTAPRRGATRRLLTLAVVVTALGLALYGWSSQPDDRAGVDSTLLRPRPRRFAAPLEVATFWRADLHAHSARSDGDSPARVVIGWYRRHGYQLLALTDHNRHLDVERYADERRSDFVLLGAEEITMAAGGKPVHVNAICTARTIGGATFDSRVAALQWATGEIARQGGVALVNHPNFLWALEAEHIAPVRSAHLLEIYSGHPSVHSDGDRRHRSVEAMWDSLLLGGSALAPAAVDDMHMLRRQRTEGVPRARPATGWVGVFAQPGPVDRARACAALRAGQLYATTGPSLQRLRLRDHDLTLWSEQPDAMVDFIGAAGELLASAPLRPGPAGELRARYSLRGDELLVRARLSSSRGRLWTPAFRTRQ